MKLNFSIVLIAKNESKTLPRLIASLAEFQKNNGEIILLDTGSTDNTASIARTLGCNVFEVNDKFLFTINHNLANQMNKKLVVLPEQPVVKENDKLFDYSKARNYASSLASNDVIAMPDCDEVYTKLDLNKIEEAITQGVEQFEYNFVFSHDAQGNEAIKFLHSKFYNRKKLYWCGIIHEVLQGNANRKFFNEDVIKLEHWQNPSDHRSRYLTGLALDCYQNPNNDRNSHYFARELLYTNRPRSAIQEFKRHINMFKWPAERAQSMIFIGDACLELGRKQEALESYHNAISCDGGRREAWLRLASYYWKENDHQRTASYAAASLQIPWNSYYGNQMSQYRHEPHELLYWALFWLGDKVAAKYHYDKCIEFWPDNPKFKQERIFFYPETPIIEIPKIEIIHPVIPSPKVSICIPTLGRLDKLKRLMNEIPKMVEYDNYEIIVEHDTFGKGWEIDNPLTGIYEPYINNIKNNKNFVFIKFGDGEEAIINKNSNIIAGNAQPYSEELSNELKLAKDRATYAIDDFKNIGGNYELVQFEDQNNFNKFLHRTDIDLIGLKAFWTSIKCSLRPKIFIGPKRLISVCKLLNSNYIEIPEYDAFSKKADILQQIKNYGRKNNPILIFSGGPLSKILIANLIQDTLDITCIDAGSSFDPIFVCQSRDNQEKKEFLQEWYSDLLETNHNYNLRIGAPITLKKAVSRAKGDLIMFLGNDCIPEPGFLREAVVAMFTHFPKLDGLIGLNDGFWDENADCVTHWLAGKKLLPLIDGEYFHTGYNHIGCDNELLARCKKLNHYYWCKTAKIKHDHPINDGFKKPLDDVYNLAWNKDSVNADRELLKSRLKLI